MALLAAACAGRRAFAHARLMRSDPKDGARLSRSPKTLEFWFNELLDDSFNTVDVFDAKSVKSRANLAREKPRVDARDRTHLTVALPILPPGEYVAQFRVLSRDGHTAPGRITFNVTALPG